MTLVNDNVELPPARLMAVPDADVPDGKAFPVTLIEPVGILLVLTASIGVRLILMDGLHPVTWSHIVARPRYPNTPGAQQSIAPDEVVAGV